jgi:formamidopyrimidine-DNA glycosylase
MPELPEVEIMARRLGAALAGAEVASSIVRGPATLKTFEPPISALHRRHLAGARRRGKHLLVDAEGGLTLLVHLMSAGRLQVFDKVTSAGDRTLRLGLRLTDGRELRLREFGTRQAAWAKLLATDAVELDEALATLGPEAWPDPPRFLELLRGARPLHALLRDQRVIAGIGRSWVDEILHEAMLSPFKRGDTLTPEEAERLREATITRLGAAVDHYEQVVQLPLPDKLPMPLTVHARQGGPCPRCGDRLEAVYLEEHTIAYCPRCQTGGKLLKDRRLSRLLK